MARIKIAQGSRITFEVTAKNDDGTVIDLTLLTKYAFVVFQKPSSGVIRFMYPNTSGYSNITPTDADEGKFKITFEVADTAQLLPGNYDAEFLVWASDGASGNWITKTPGGKEFIELCASPTYHISS
jgi:hypothetical protein